MKKILFFQTNRCHQRQKLLLDELSKSFEVIIGNAEIGEGDMGQIASAMTGAVYNFIKKCKPDAVLVRGDRYETLSIAMISAYMGIPIIHIEGFDLSGSIDNKVRYAVSYLSDYHFVTNDDSALRAISVGFKNIWNHGSLDCEYALSVKPSKPPRNKYIVVLHHFLPNEHPGAISSVVEAFKSEYEIKGVKGNTDYGIKNPYQEEYSQEDFINLLRHASCLVGNSSAGVKEAGVLGTPVVNAGSRQMNRLKTHNIVNVPYEIEPIKQAIEFQLKHGRYEPDLTYYREGTSKKIAEEISKFIWTHQKN